MTFAIPKMFRLLPLVALLAMLMLSACSGDDNSSNITLPSTTAGTEATEAPETTQAPETTEAPETTDDPATTTAAGAATTAPESGESDNDLTLVFIVGGILLIILIVALVAGRGTQETTVTTAAPPPPAPPASPWSAAARTAYANTRWCADHITDQLATWRGDVMVDGDQSATDPTAATNAETWSQLGGRMSAATNSLYSLEGVVPAASQPVVRSVVDSLNSVRSAAEEVAKSQVDVRNLADGRHSVEGSVQAQLAAAKTQRTQAVDDLNAKRHSLNTALGKLGALGNPPAPPAT